MCFYYLERPENKLNCFETFTLYLAVMINFAWVTLASFLSVTTLFKKFEVEFPGDEVIWAVIAVVLAYSVFYLSAIIYKHFFYGAVFIYYNFMLFGKYVILIADSGKRLFYALFEIYV